MSIWNTAQRLAGGIAIFLALMSTQLRGNEAAGTTETQPIRVMDETAIPFTGFLSKAEFDKRFPGESVESVAELESGWYVIYEHEALRYYFGPMLLESTGEDYLAQLREIVEVAVAQRPSIEGYRLELSFEPQPADEAGNADGSDATASEDEASGSGGSPPPPPRKPGLFEFLRRLFGF